MFLNVGGCGKEMSEPQGVSCTEPFYKNSVAMFLRECVQSIKNRPDECFFHLIEANTSRISGELQIHDHSLIRLRFGNLVENIETHFYYPVYEHLFAIKGTSKKLPIGNTHMGCYVFLCSPS